MPRKTPRGGRYTTGIKRAPGGGYGGQSTGRRPICGVIVIYGPGLALAAGAVARWRGWA
jgi:hypothetical protein